MTHNPAKIFIENFLQKKTDQFYALPQSGSSRKNFVAIVGNEKYIVTENENIRENESFFYFSKVFSSYSLPTPKIVAISEDKKTYIQSHLGNQTLSEIIQTERVSLRIESLVMQTLEALFTLQNTTKNQIDFSQSFDYEAYDSLPIWHDLYYFKNFFIDVLEIEYHKSGLLKEFKNMVEKIILCEPKGIMIRDFQSRNIMVNDADKVSFIDYQSAMEGPLLYDVLSFLFQAKANFSADFKEKMLQHYIQFHPRDLQNQLNESKEILLLIRYLQVLGAYGFRGLIQRKKHFIESIDQGILNISSFMNNWKERTDFPILNTIILQLSTEQTKNKINHLINS